MSTHVEYVPAGSAQVRKTPKGGLVLAYDEIVHIEGSRSEILDLIERMSAALSVEHDSWTSESRQHFIDTGRYILR